MDSNGLKWIQMNTSQKLFSGGWEKDFINPQKLRIKTEYRIQKMKKKMDNLKSISSIISLTLIL